MSISAWKCRSGSSFAFACNAVWSSRTFSDPGRLSPVVTPCILSASLSNQGSFPPPALPGLQGNTSPSATLPARTAPRGVSVGVCAPPTGLPVLPPPPSSMRAAVTTPAEPAGAHVALFPADGSLPRYSGGSASALPVSRPAQRSLALRPAWSLSHPRRPVSSKCFSRSRYLLQPLRLLPAGATLAGRDSHPLRDGAFPRRTGRVEDWRASFRVRWLVRRFRSGPQSGSRGHVSSPRSPNPACGFPALGSPVGSCVSRTEGRNPGSDGFPGCRVLR